MNVSLIFLKINVLFLMGGGGGGVGQGGGRKQANNHLVLQLSFIYFSPELRTYLKNLGSLKLCQLPFI